MALWHVTLSLAAIAVLAGVIFQLDARGALERAEVAFREGDNDRVIAGGSAARTLATVANVSYVAAGLLGLLSVFAWHADAVGDRVAAATAHPPQAPPRSASILQRRATGALTHG